jgi:hypothetical protein
MHKTAALILSSFIAMQHCYAQYTGGVMMGLLILHFFGGCGHPPKMINKSSCLVI